MFTDGSELVLHSCGHMLSYMMGSSSRVGARSSAGMVGGGDTGTLHISHVGSVKGLDKRLHYVKQMARRGQLLGK